MVQKTDLNLCHYYQLISASIRIKMNEAAVLISIYSLIFEEKILSPKLKIALT